MRIQLYRFPIIAEAVRGTCRTLFPLLDSIGEDIQYRAVGQLLKHGWWLEGAADLCGDYKLGKSLQICVSTS